MADIVREKASKSIDTMKNMVSDVMSGNCYLIVVYLVCIIFLIIFSYSLYLRKEFTKAEVNVKKMKDELTTKNFQLTAFNEYDLMGDYGKGTKFALIDYYIKGSYNSCCTGPIINGSVDLRALKTVISQGVRFLDFEIYLRKNKIIVAAGRDNIYIKDTLNELNISSVLETVKREAIEGNVINNSDPLILSFRIMSENDAVYEGLANSIKKIFNDYLLSANYGYCGIKTKYNKKNIFENNVLFADIGKLKRKVIIFAKGPSNDPTSYKKNKKFYELMNGGDEDGRINYKPDYKVNNDSERKNIEEHKNHYCISYPDVTTTKNSSASIHWVYGCQAILMNFGAGFNNYQMDYYNKKFALKALVLKTKKLRRTRLFAGKATPQDPRLNPVQTRCNMLIPGTNHVQDLGLIPGGAMDCQ